MDVIDLILDKLSLAVVEFAEPYLRPELLEDFIALFSQLCLLSLTLFYVVDLGIKLDKLISVT